MSAKKVDVASLLKSKNIAPIAKRKSDTPMIDGHEKLADALHELYEQQKQAEAEFRAKEEELITKARVLYEKSGTDGDFSKAFNFPGKETPGMQIVWQDKFSAIPMEHEDLIKKTLGDRYEALFDQKRELSLADTSDETIQVVHEKLGEELFEKLIQVKVTIVAKGDMDRKQFSLPNQVRALLKQAKAACRLRTSKD
jgi:hypothetical protein